MTTLFYVSLLCVLFFISNVAWALVAWHITSVWSDICHDMADTCMDILGRVIKDEMEKNESLRGDSDEQI